MKCHQTGDHIREEELWGIYWQLCRGLMHMHAKGVIHRDLKPMNILVTSNMQFKIGDFSESRRLKYGKVLKLGPGRQIGSPFAMAPEVIKKAAYDFKVIL